MNKSVLTGLCGLVMSVSAWAQNAMPVMELTAGFHRIEAEVAAPPKLTFSDNPECPPLTI